MASSTSARSYLRSSRRRVGATPAGVSAASGMAARASVEALERRQMLFSLTITQADIDPATGRGYKDATFGYTIPYLATTQTVGTAAATTRTEEFDDEDLRNQLGSGTVLTGSSVRVLHNIAPGTNISIVQAPGGPDVTDREMRVRFAAAGQQVRFQVLASDTDTAANGLSFQSVSFDVTADPGSPVGLDTDNTTVDLLLDGAVVRSFTGAALRQSSSTGTGIGRFSFAITGTDSAYDEIRISAQNAPLDAFRVDNMNFSLPAGNFAPIVSSLIFGARVALSGPVGATLQVTDLYGRDMRQTLSLGIREGAQVTLVDSDDDGIPNFNDGIGAITLSNTDANTSVQMVGGRIENDGANFTFTQVDTVQGIFSDFESAGFGFQINLDPTTGRTTQVVGLPPGSGSVIIGSPFVRPRNGYNPGQIAPGAAGTTVTTGFTRSDQGIFVTGGRAVGVINISGMVFGSSNLTGSVDTFAAGYLLGSVTVAGDAGTIYSGTDGGMWYSDPIPNPPANFTFLHRTDAQIIVGRTLGELAVAGRSLFDVTVIGDLNSPSTRPARDATVYSEREVNYAIPFTADEAATIGAGFNSIDTRFPQFSATGILRPRPAVMFGATYFRNDSLLSSEYVGSSATAVRITGDLGYGDPVNSQVDSVDTFAFAADGTQDVSISFDSLAFYARVVDKDGRTIVALQGSRQVGTANATSMKFRPQQADVYYLVVSDQGPDGDPVTGAQYEVSITGMASVTLGSYRAGSNSGVVDGNTVFRNTINVLSGSVGSIRVGTGYTKGDGSEVDPQEIYNPRTGSTVDDHLSFTAGTFAVAGNLYNVTAGNDMGLADGSAPLAFQIGGNLGTVYTGRSAIGGTGPLEGDIKNSVSFDVGGNVGAFDISGALGIDQDATAFAQTGATLSIVTGTRTGVGNIGMIRFGSHVSGDNLSIRTPNNSTIGALLISQDIADDPANTLQGSIGGNVGVLTTLGSGSDVRFFDVYKIDSRTRDNNDFPIFVNTFTEFVDDGGGRVRIRVVGDGLTNGAFAGNVIAMPINGAQGVAIARITVDLAGAALEIESVGSSGAGDVISIGRIIITGSTAASSGITIRGNIETDVWQIQQTGGDGLLFITNSTPRGDLVAIDVQSLSRLEITTGDLGRTQVPAFGPQLIGPFLGTAAGFVNTNGGALGIPTGATGGVIEGNWNGNPYRGVTDSGDGAGNASGDDIGLPFDPYLNGLVVRNGNLNTVSVGGAVGDVIAQGGEVVSVTANADRITPSGRFDGIIGSIFGTRISLVNVGDGLRANTPSAPLADTGIYATDDILTVEATLPGSFISSNIIAGNAVIQGGAGTVINGIDIVRVNSQGGDFVDAFIGTVLLDGWWVTQAGPYNNDRYTGSIQTIQGRQADLYRTEIQTNRLQDLTLTDGFFDASFVRIGTELGTVTATGYRNSTATGGTLEFRVNRIDVANNIGTITTTGRLGDIADLSITALGSVTNEISARNFTRVLIDVANTLPLLRATGGLRGLDIRSGQITRLESAGTIATSSFQVSGPIVNFTTGDSIINSTISSTGPFGRIDTLTAVNLLNGQVNSSGPVGTIRVTNGSAQLNVTTTGTTGTVNLIQASQDLDLTTDISATVNTITAGRHIGNRANPNVILIRGNLLNATAGGQLYSDLRIGQALTGAVTIGRVSSRAQDSQLGSGSIIAYGAINNIAISGDFNGNIISYSGGINTVTITDGSFLPGKTMAAHDGHFNSLVINRGSLFGNVHSDWILYSVSVIGTADGVFGDIGINPTLFSSTPYDAFRNQLPPGVVATAAVNGPRISAGWNLGIVSAPNGSAFETTFVAGRGIGTIAVGESITNDGLTGVLGTTIAAGDSIFLVSAGNQINNAFILAGFLDLGSDQLPGGVGTARDTVQSGMIYTVTSGIFGMVRVVMSAGTDPGADGIISTADDQVAPGVSFVNAVVTSGEMTAVSAISDSFGLQAIAETRLAKFGTNFPNSDPDIDPGFGTPGTPIASGGSLSFTWGADTGTIFFSGPGEAFWDAAGGRVVLRNTSLASNVSIYSDTGSLTDFSVVTNDDASVGALYIQSSLFGNSKIVVDAYMYSLVTGFVEGTSSIRIGGDCSGITLGSFTGTTLSARYLAGLVISTDLGSRTPDVGGSSRVSLLAAGNIIIAGADRGRINVDRDIQVISVGRLDNARIRAGASLGTLSAGSSSKSRASFRDFLGAVNITGNADQTQIMIGGDLGRDAEIGGTGLNADQATTGFAGNVNIGGSFARSDLVAGSLRGADGFFGTSDDQIADGRSSLGAVTISGTAVGSNRDTESYRVSSTGVLGAVVIGGLPSQPTGNFRSQVLTTAPEALAVEDLSVTVDSQTYTAKVTFNQAINFSTFSAALAVFELRGSTQIRLIEGPDYSISYNANENAALIVFSSTVTQRNLPQSVGVPGPGVYRFELLQSVLRAQLVNQRLDGNGDGFAGTTDNYSQDDIVGDAGDKLTSGRVPVTDPNTGQVAKTVDFYGPTNLDPVLDNNSTPDGLPDANQVFTLRGAIGDHPDNDTNYFSFASDSDVYTITLQAGQILRLGEVTGAARSVQVTVIGPSGTAGSEQTALANGVSQTAATALAATPEQNLLALISGVYTIVVSNTNDVFNPTSVQNIAPVANGVGDYSFTIEVFDDGNTGFGASTDSGDGTAIVNAPAPVSFAGVDGILGTADDIAQIVIGSYAFTYNNATGVVTGNNGGDLASTRGADGTLFSSINSAIGPTRTAGLPGEVFPDADVYHLNNRQTIAPGTRLTITVKLNEFGTDLGAINQNADVTRNTFFTDNSSDVQFGVFQTTGATAVGDAKLLFSPSEFSPNGGAPNTVLATGTQATYGFNADGDFYISFVAPSRQGGSDTSAASYAIYLQGVFNGDYRIEIAQSPVTETITRKTQNVFIETRGGTIDWLEAGGRSTTLEAFDASTLGFTGRLSSGQAVQDYIIEQLIAQLNALYSSAGIDVRFSTNPVDFEFQSFSTVYLSKTTDPTNAVFGSAFFLGTANASVLTQDYGYSQHSDPLNTDLNDEAVVFTQPFSLFGLTPSQTDIDRFSTVLTASVSRRVGELLGLRTTSNDALNPADSMAANTVVRSSTGTSIGISTLDRALSTRSDTSQYTNFYLGNQNSGSLLSKYLRSTN